MEKRQLRSTQKGQQKKRLEIVEVIGRVKMGRISFEEGNWEKVIIKGINCLFSGARIDRDTIPEGKYISWTAENIAKMLIKQGLDWKPIEDIEFDAVYI